ncbi:hypothetical protein ACLOAV_004796 [Pseudogymnoascus australis]
MLSLDDITYSRDACISAFRDYYDFLTKMYLDESDIVHPPAGGWPSITTAYLRDFGKSDEVISLLRSLPYIRHYSPGREGLEGAPYTKFADYQQICQHPSGAADLKIVTEGEDAYTDVPDHVIGLTCGGRNNPVFLLDTELGIVYWVECYSEIIMNPKWKALMVLEDPCDYAPENKADWRYSGPAWAVGDFFEILKDHFRMLHFVPQNGSWVTDDFLPEGKRRKGMTRMVQDVYREHGWPDLERYRKQECLEAVKVALQKSYPDA